MDQQISGADRAQTCTSVEREGDRKIVAMRTFNAPPSLVYRAWSEPELFQRWWVPKSAPGVSLVSCDLEVRTGGRYRLEFGAGDSNTMAFHGKYLEVIPNERIVWTNDEDEDGAITTVTVENQGRTTLLHFHEVYPTKDAREDALRGSAAALPEQLEQLDQLLSKIDR